MAKRRTEMQQRFLDVLFTTAEGDVSRAKTQAGYAEDVSIGQVVGPLADDILALTKKYLSTGSAKAAYSMVSILTNPTDLGTKEKIAAAKDILDRAGLVKTEKVEVSSTTPIFILPEKKSDE